MDDEQIISNPQLEDGYVRIANELLDALCRTRIAGEERQVFDVVLRKTYGFNKKNDAISLSQFVMATGLTRNHVCRAIKSLEAKRLLSPNKETGSITTYCINKNYSQWRLVPNKGRPNIDSPFIGSPKKENLAVPKKRHTINTSINNVCAQHFESFYASYPKKRNRPAAEKAWKKINPDDGLLVMIFKALEQQKQSEGWLKEKGQYIPLPASWLNGRRWEDLDATADNYEESLFRGLK